MTLNHLQLIALLHHVLLLWLHSYIYLIKIVVVQPPRMLSSTHNITAWQHSRYTTTHIKQQCKNCLLRKIHQKWNYLLHSIPCIWVEMLRMRKHRRLRRESWSCWTNWWCWIWSNSHNRRLRRSLPRRTCFERKNHCIWHQFMRTGWRILAGPGQKL